MAWYAMRKPWLLCLCLVTLSSQLFLTPGGPSARSRDTSPVTRFGVTKEVVEEGDGKNFPRNSATISAKSFLEVAVASQKLEA